MSAKISREDIAAAAGYIGHDSDCWVSSGMQPPECGCRLWTRVTALLASLGYEVPA